MPKNVQKEATQMSLLEHQYCLDHCEFLDLSCLAVCIGGSFSARLNKGFDQKSTVFVPIDQKYLP
jgi:hypothetical protein